MKNKKVSILLTNGFKNWYSSEADDIELLNSGSGSNRNYYRFFKDEKTFIGTWSENLKENEAFFYFTNYFYKKGIRVPKLHFISPERNFYIQQDIGNTNLLNKVHENGFSLEVSNYYKESLSMLWKMQQNNSGISYNNCYPRAAFDEQSLMWDLNYFKYYFLKVSGVEFDEQLLENDMLLLAQTLSVSKDQNYFMFRDFQARNIHIYKDEIWFIDYQGGRRGPYLYDVASLLYQASAGLSSENRKELLDYYYQIISQDMRIDQQAFEQEFYQMVFIRVIQTLGAYGFRGLIEGKAYFKNSIPAALNNLQELMQTADLNLKIPYFLSKLEELMKIKNIFEE
ncbi:MAG: aminoglycoside phosphotransferase [Bacteroidetes bacterium 4572_77]|nr:MAG: aminoglycoside phosphotransferase [Bacteroidetes bacterium 4572_77]